VPESYEMSCNAEGPNESLCEKAPHSEEESHKGKDRHGINTHIWSGPKLDKRRTTWRCT
jgi:hypothetical protein